LYIVVFYLTFYSGGENSAWNGNLKEGVDNAESKLLAVGRYSVRTGNDKWIDAVADIF